jgi:hypothetical protein
MSEMQMTSTESRIRKALSHLTSLLVPGEVVQTYAVQRRLFALLHRRELVSATTGRLIGMKRSLIAGFTPVDIRWQDIKSARVRVGIFGSDIRVTALTQPDLAIGGAVIEHRFTGLRKDDAQAVYRACQAQEQAWREKRRLRELEELRAKSGGFQGSTSSGAGFARGNGDSTHDDLTSRLGRAKEMLDKGLISDSEFETIKARVVAEL